MADMTDEEAEEMRAALDAYEAKKNEADKAARRTVVAPLAEAGLGSDEPLNITAVELVELLRTSSRAEGADNLLSRMCQATADAFETLHDRVARVMAETAPAEDPE